VPLFEYGCRQCGAVTELFVRHYSEPPSPPCERCQSSDTVRLVSRFSFKTAQRAKYDESLREKMLPFLRSQPGIGEALAEGSGSEEAREFAITERIGQRVDSVLENNVFKNLPS